MRHSVHVMFGRVSEETLLGLKQYVLKYGGDEANDFFTAIHIDETKTDLVIREAVRLVPDNAEVVYAERFNTSFSDSVNLKKSETESIKNYLFHLKTSLVNADHMGDYAELHYCFYIPLFDEAAWAMAKILIDIINTDVYPQPHVDILGLCADFAPVYFPEAKSYDVFLKKTNQTLKQLVDYKKSSSCIRHIILMDNKQGNGLQLRLTKRTILFLFGEFALLCIEKYRDLYAGLMDDKELCAVGLSSMGIDRFYFVQYLLRRAYLYAIDREQVSAQEVDVNKISLISKNILGKWVHLMSDIMATEVKQRQKTNKSDEDIVVEVRPILQERLRALFGEVDAQLQDKQLNIPEKKALLAVLMGLDDPTLVNMMFNDDQLIVDDLEREAMSVFVDANNLLLAREDTKEGAILSYVMTPNEPEEPVYYPLDELKKNRSLIKHCLATIRELQENEKRLKAQLEGQKESEKCLIENGGVIYKGKTYKLLPQVDDPPLQENYEPHSVSAPSVDIRGGFTPIKDQSALGSCLPHALISVFEYFLKNNGEAVPDLSELFLYYNARARKGDVSVDAGSTLQAAMASLCEQGICLEQFWPYEEEKFAEKPSDEAYADAAHRKVKTALNVSIKDENAIRSALSDGFPVLVSIKLFESFTTGANGFIPIPDDGEKQSDKHGSHAIVLCGYSDKEKIFIARNSWGRDFGDNGYCYIPYAYITNPELTHWAAIIKEIVTAREVVGEHTEITNNKVFTIKTDQRAHVKFDQTDASINLMVTQASLAQQQDLLSQLMERDQLVQHYYAVLKQQTIDRNLINQLKDNSSNRLNLLIDETKKQREKTEEEKFDKLKAFDRTTIRSNIIRALIVIVVAVMGFITQRIISNIADKHNDESKKAVPAQVVSSSSDTNSDSLPTSTTVEQSVKAPNVLKWFLWADLAYLLFSLLLLYFRFRVRKEMEEEYNSKLERLGDEIAKFNKDLEQLRINFFMASTMLSDLFKLQDSLTGRYHKITALRNNLTTWAEMLEKEDPNEFRSSHPTSVFLLSSEVLDEYFEREKESITKGLHLSDFLDQFELTDDGLAHLKILMENTVSDKVLNALDGFSVFKYLAKVKEYPYLQPIKSEHTINDKLQELSRKAEIFLQCKTTAGAINPQTSIFIHLEGNELNKWGEIYPQSFAIRPNSVQIQSQNKIIIANLIQLDLKDVLFYE